MSFDDDTNSFRPTKELEAHLGACPLNVGLFTWYKPLVNKPLEGLDEGSYCSWPYIQKIEAFRAFGLQIVRIYSREKGSFYLNEGLDYLAPYCPWGSNKPVETKEALQAKAQARLQEARKAKASKLLKRAKGQAQAKPVTKPVIKAQEGPKKPKIQSGPRAKDRSNSIIFVGLQAKPLEAPKPLDIIQEGPSQAKGLSKEAIRALIQSLKPSK